jgi:hypothetical protein
MGKAKTSVTGYGTVPWFRRTSPGGHGVLAGGVTVARGRTDRPVAP